MRRCVLLLGCVAFVASLACAQGTAPSGSRALFADGVRKEADGTLAITRDRELRMPGTSKERADLTAGTNLRPQTEIKVRAQGKVYDVELWTGERPGGDGAGGFGGRVAVLAVFPPGATAPTDVAEVAADRETYLDDKLVPLGGDDAFQIFNAHLNAGEDFNAITLFHLRDGRLRRIAESGTYAARGGDCAEATRDVLHWESVAGTDPLPNVVADLETIRAPRDVTKEDCPKRNFPEKRTHVRTTYRFDAKLDRYVKVAAAPAKGR